MGVKLIVICVPQKSQFDFEWATHYIHCIIQITLTFLYLYKPDEQSDISQVKYVPVFPRCKKYNCMQANKNLLDWLPHFVWHHGCKPKMKAVLTQRTWSVLVQCIRSRHRCSCWLPTSPGCSYCCITVLLWWQTYYYSGSERRGFTGLRKKKKKKSHQGLWRTIKSALQCLQKHSLQRKVTGRGRDSKCKLSFKLTAMSILPQQ